MPDSGIIQRIERHVAPTRFEVTPFQHPRPDERMRFEVNLVARAGEKMRERAQVEPNLESWSTFDIACDEGIARRRSAISQQASPSAR